MPEANRAKLGRLFDEHLCRTPHHKSQKGGPNTSFVSALKLFLYDAASGLDLGTRRAAKMERLTKLERTFLQKLLLLVLLLSVTSCGAETNSAFGENEASPAPIERRQPSSSRLARRAGSPSASPMSPELRAAYIVAVQSEAPAEYRFEYRAADRAVTYCPAQRFRAELGPEGLEVLPKGRFNHWRLQLRAVAIGRGNELVALAKPSGLRIAGNRASIELGKSLEEWYASGRLGIEQGFELAEPAPGQGELELEIAVSGLEPELAANGKWVSLKTTQGRAVVRYSDLFAYDASGQMLATRMEVIGTAIRLIVDDRRARYPIRIDPLVWAEQQKFLPTVDAYYDNFGKSVSVYGDTALVGTPRSDDLGENSGSAYVFVRTGTSWSEQQRLLASDGGPGDVFGYSVSLYGDTALVGAYLDDGAAGSAYVFERTGTNWSEQQKLSASDGVASDRFGFPVSLYGDTALLAADGDDDKGSESGSVYVFVRAGTSWSEQQKLTASDGATGDSFGHSVSVHSDTALVGSYHDDDRGSMSGSAYVFARTGTGWFEQQKLTASDGASGDKFGQSASICGDTILVGANGDNDKGSESGAAYVFVRTGTNWSEQQKLTASDGATNDDFGSSVSVGGDTAVIGARLDDDLGQNDGSAYVFVRTGPVWSEQAKVLPSGSSVGGDFGRSVSLYGDTILIGASGDDELTPNSGAAYVFLRTGTSWSNQEKVFHSGSAGGDLFGHSVSVHSDTALVGAYEDDGSVSVRGAAYVFLRTGPVWSLQQKLVVSDIEGGDYFGYTVSLHGDTALVGAPRDGSSMVWDTGAAYVYVRTGTNWSEQQKLSAGDGELEDYFGYAVSLYDDTALVGSYRDDDQGSDSGSAYVFIRTGVNWFLQQKLTATDGEPDDWFGSSVSLFYDTALVGAYQEDALGSDAGAAYVFLRTGTSWAEQQKLLASDGVLDDYFGYAVSLYDDTALVGAYQEDALGSDAGAAYVFLRIGASWTEQQKLSASDGAASAQFGWSVALYGDTALVGAHQDADLGSDAGAAYVFWRSGTTWVEQQKLIASDGAAGDHFGGSVSIYDNVSLVGAPRDDTLGLNSGSAYVLECGNALGEPCTAWDDCGSGHCADDVCCNLQCSGTCMACVHVKTGEPAGQCGFIEFGKDPDDECGNGSEESCDGAGACKKHDGQSCTGHGECLSNWCVDDVCCPIECTAPCMACATTKTGGADGQCDFVSFSTDPDNECGANQSCDGAGACKKHDGQGCGGPGECLSDFCEDYACCDTQCDSTCMACSGTKTGLADGQCSFVIAGSDPDDECSDDVVVQSCDGAGDCKTLVGEECDDGSECISGHCADGVCCDQICGGTCQACVHSNPDVDDGQCADIPSGTDPDGECGVGSSCNGAGACKKNNGQDCETSDQCMSQWCVDDVCCEGQCKGLCMACTAEKTSGTDGQCGNVTTGSDPDDECQPDLGYPASCGADGHCENGHCRNYALSGVECQPSSCMQGTAYSERRCDGSGTCSAATEVAACAPYVCAESACRKNCETDEHCVSPATCDKAPGASTGICVAGTKCDGDHTLTKTDGTTQDCAPFRCTAAGACLNNCISSADCVSGYVCNSDGLCEANVRAIGETVGCSSSRHPTRSGNGTWAGWLLLLGGALVRSRRKPRAVAVKPVARKA